MASEKTKILRRDNLLRRALAQAELAPVQAPRGANRAARRRQLQDWCRARGVSYAEAREMIREEEARMRANGIDPWASNELTEDSNGSTQTPPDGTPHLTGAGDRSSGTGNGERLGESDETEAGSSEGQVDGASNKDALPSE